MNREVETNTVFEQRAQKLFAHFFTPPGRNGSFENGQVFIRDNQVWVNAQHFPKSVATPTGSVRVVEREQVDAWLLECNTVEFKFIGKGTGFLPDNIDPTGTFSFIKRCLYRIRKAIQVVFVGFAIRIVQHRAPVNKNFQ